MILEAVVRDVLTNPQLRRARDFYGTEGRREAALVTVPGYDVPWPSGFESDLAGWTLFEMDGYAERDPSAQRLLGIRIDAYMDEGDNPTLLFSAPISVTIMNVGGSANGSVIGGCFVNYRPRLEGGVWTVTLEGVFDP